MTALLSAASIVLSLVCIALLVVVMQAVKNANGNNGLEQRLTT
jgi:hypothetical protein